ncbi:hypothetical protein NDU88_011079 [Pleurodeles waltl]|uniref:BHLH domain-containing protein n=1 Tax=Pleurodeles waltl TaxID=8319 RepID=A0AAV7S4D1_PLEWA|nr:hypothetical protein NDU88_011079 [Pleurodeles waltl]
MGRISSCHLSHSTLQLATPPASGHRSAPTPSRQRRTRGIQAAPEAPLSEPSALGLRGLMTRPRADLTDTISSTRWPAAVPHQAVSQFVRPLSGRSFQHPLGLSATCPPGCLILCTPEPTTSSTGPARQRRPALFNSSLRRLTGCLEPTAAPSCAAKLDTFRCRTTRGSSGGGHNTQRGAQTRQRAAASYQCLHPTPISHVARGRVKACRCVPELRSRSLKNGAEIPTGHGILKPTSGKQCPENAARERSRVRTLRQAFLALQAALPSVPPDTKLSKLDVLVLATSYIAHLTQTLDQDRQLPEDSQILKGPGYLHPMKKWPMRSRLYAGAMGGDFSGLPTGGKV